jgi:ATP-dependent DNA helicase RecG
MLKKELQIYRFIDLLEHFPYRHIDKTRVNRISELLPGIFRNNGDEQAQFAQVIGVLQGYEVVGQRAGKRLVADLKDATGTMELTWFRGLNWIQKTLETGQVYRVYGRVSYFNDRPQIIHPELEAWKGEEEKELSRLEPVYSTTEKLRARGLGARQIGKLTQTLFGLLSEKDLPENLPESIVRDLKLVGRYKAFQQIHFPQKQIDYEEALKRLKFEELFIAQVRLALVRSGRHRFSKGVVFDRVGDLFNTFYERHLPFALTNAQKKVIKEIRTDTAKGWQMNRLLQGDVGSGKTIVALLIMLLAADNGYQSCLMAPTEILAQQHFATLRSLLGKMDVTVELLTGSTKTAERKKILAGAEDQSIQILVGTHALIEETVQFGKLGLVVIDEQHRFGVEQRARLWKKAKISPHILVMTATPIPRTLAMTAYGDLDYSVIDELPPGRIPVTTVHRYETNRHKVMDFIRGEIEKGRQVYIIFPLIEESAKLDYENLMKGYENVKAYFPEPRFRISMVHGRQPSIQKETNMRRFVTGDTHIMVSTTVIEVGVDVPNASVMVIESAEKFGLSQLHQLRGRVGRGAEKSYCILLTGSKLGKEARERIRIMTSSSNGFEIAEKDLELRGPGDIQGTRQSGELNFKLADIVKDRFLLEQSKALAVKMVESDPDLLSAENLQLKNFLQQKKGDIAWSKIS